MTKFVKLENGNYINVDTLIEIGMKAVYMFEGLVEPVTDKDIGNILKASEE